MKYHRVMLEGVPKHIGKKLGMFFESDPNNYNGPLRSYMHLRVRLDIKKALKKQLTVGVQ